MIGDLNQKFKTLPGIIKMNDMFWWNTFKFNIEDI